MVRRGEDQDVFNTATLKIRLDLSDQRGSAVEAELQGCRECKASAKYDSLVRDLLIFSLVVGFEVQLGIRFTLKLEELSKIRAPCAHCWFHRISCFWDSSFHQYCNSTVASFYFHLARLQVCWVCWVGCICSVLGVAVVVAFKSLFLLRILMSNVRTQVISTSCVDSLARCSASCRRQRTVSDSNPRTPIVNLHVLVLVFLSDRPTRTRTCNLFTI